jgi:hypothetical protein
MRPWLHAADSKADPATPPKQSLPDVCMRVFCNLQPAHWGLRLASTSWRVCKRCLRVCCMVMFVYYYTTTDTITTTILLLTCSHIYICCCFLLFHQLWPNDPKNRDVIENVEAHARAQNTAICFQAPSCAAEHSNRHISLRLLQSARRTIYCACHAA